MAKEKANEEEVVTEEGAEAASKGKGGRFIMITDPVGGEQIKRVDFIRREVIENGRTRREVTNQLCEIEGREVQFQIVYAATKDYRPPKKEKPAEENAETDTGAEE